MFWVLLVIVLVAMLMVGMVGQQIYAFKRMGRQEAENLVASLKEPR